MTRTPVHPAVMRPATAPQLAAITPALCAILFLALLLPGAGARICAKGESLSPRKQGSVQSSRVREAASTVQQDAPFRIAVVGLAHGHVDGFFSQYRSRPDIQIVGIAESDADVAARAAKRLRFDTALLYTSLDDMLVKAHPQAVVTYTSTFEHRRVVETCARHGVHVMMEKPLAVSIADAHAIEKAAADGKIQVLVNFETTWYRSNRAAYEMAHDKGFGDIRKIVVHDGHSGPKEIGCGPDFLRWLTDPKLNGAGALFDFGCYGADLATWLLDGQRPTSVTAVTQQIKPDIYPNVDDEATIVVAYPKTQVIIQASWNWPFDRKDMEIYGQSGTLFVPRKDVIKLRTGTAPESEKTPPPLPAAEADPLSYLAAVVRKEIKPSGLSSLEVNLTVTEILDAARESARTGKRVDLK